MTWKRFLLINERRGQTEDTVRGKAISCIRDSPHVDVLQDPSVLKGWYHVGRDMGLGKAEALGLKRVLHLAGTVVGRDVGVIDMVRLKGMSEELGGEEAEVAFNREHLSLHMQMIMRGCSVTTRIKTEAAVLHHLQTVDGGR